MRTTSCMETVGRKSTHRLDRITCRVGATCPLAQRTLQGGLSTCHVKRLVRARLPASRAENRLNRQNMFEQNNVKKNLCVHYQTSYLWIEKTSSSRGWGDWLTCAAPKSMVFGPFWSENGETLCLFWSGIGYGFWGNYGSVWTYRKIPKIRPGAYSFQRPLLRGLFLEGLIYGGKFAFKIDWAGLIFGRICTVVTLFYFVFEGQFQVQASRLIFGGAI